jgi:hypothetical protein
MKGCMKTDSMLARLRAAHSIMAPVVLLAAIGAIVAGCGTTIESAVPAAAVTTATQPVQAPMQASVYPSLGSTPKAAAKPLTPAEEQKLLGNLKSARASQAAEAPAPDGTARIDALRKEAEKHVDDTLNAIGSQ